MPVINQSYLSVTLLGTDGGPITCLVSFLGSAGQDLLGPTVDNWGFVDLLLTPLMSYRRMKRGEMRISGLLRLEGVDLDTCVPTSHIK